jgi:UDP-N-acetylmuramyl pentapeptide phosphotransferase/UDP-N-acetylglucosamine-1-phosphate transferase
VIPKILVIAKKHSLFDNIDDRKCHEGAIPRIGGVSFVPCLSISMMIIIGLYYKYSSFFLNHPLISPNIEEICLFGAGVLFLYLGAIKDDLIGLKFRYKFVIQIISSVLITISGLYINNLYGFLGINELTPWIGVPLTVLFIVFVTNALNLIDGMDGLASGISIIALSIYGTLFLLYGQWIFSALAFSTLGVLIPFFYYNVFGKAKKGSKIFMGDSGSLTLGFILGCLCVKSLNYNPDQVEPIYSSALIIAITPILIPMLDVLRVLLARLKARKHLFKADRRHIHHKLLNIGLDNTVSLIVLLFTTSFFCILNYLLTQYIRAEFILLLDIIIWTVLNMIMSYYMKKNGYSLKTIKCKILNNEK